VRGHGTNAIQLERLDGEMQDGVHSAREKRVPGSAHLLEALMDKGETDVESKRSQREQQREGSVSVRTRRLSAAAPRLCVTHRTRSCSPEGARL
jgi:hypothetical protein